MTTPTSETVLNGINLLDEKMESRFERLEGRFENLEGRVGKIESELVQLRQDMNTGFRRVERKIELLNRDFLAIRGDNEDLLQRVENLESQAT